MFSASTSVLSSICTPKLNLQKEKNIVQRWSLAEQHYNKHISSQQKNDDMKSNTVARSLKISCNPLEKVEKNDSCALCHANIFMIGCFIQTLKDLCSEMKSVKNYKKTELEKQNAEIEELKDKCKHLEDAVEYINSLNQSEQGEISSKYSKRKGQYPEEFVEQFW